MKKYFVEYLKSLDYLVKEEREDIVLFVHKKTGINLQLVFSYFDTGETPLFEKDFPGKKIIILSSKDIELIGIEYFEEHENEIDSDNTVIIYDENYMEHIMKDIWFFLNR